MFPRISFNLDSGQVLVNFTAPEKTADSAILMIK
jgi:hypothetical protein